MPGSPTSASAPESGLHGVWLRDYDRDLLRPRRPDWAWFVGQRPHDPSVLAGSGLDLPLHRMGDEKEAVGQERQLGVDAVELVVDQCPALAVAEIRLVLDLELGADVVRAHAVGVIDRVDDDGLERVPALGAVAGGLDGHLDAVGPLRPSTPY